MCTVDIALMGFMSWTGPLCHVFVSSVVPKEHNRADAQKFIAMSPMFVFPAFDFDHEAAVHPRLLETRSLKAEREGCIIFFSFILMDPVSEDFHWKNGLYPKLRCTIS